MCETTERVVVRVRGSAEPLTLWTIAIVASFSPRAIDGRPAIRATYLAVGVFGRTVIFLGETHPRSRRRFVTISRPLELRDGLDLRRLRLSLGVTLRSQDVLRERPLLEPALTAATFDAFARRAEALRCGSASRSAAVAQLGGTCGAAVSEADADVYRIKAERYVFARAPARANCRLETIGRAARIVVKLVVACTLPPRAAWNFRPGGSP